MPRLESNLDVMARWCADSGVLLWPHIKTTMCRPVVERQLAAGADGVTVATPAQAAIAASWGCRRILIANEVVNPVGLQQICGLAGEADLTVLVDSVAGIAGLDEAARTSGVVVDVLIDVGTAGGRSGVRAEPAAIELALRVRSARGLRLIGVSAYEGVVPAVRDAETLRLVDEHCRFAAAVFVELVSFFGTANPVFTAGGSAFPDRVVAAAGPVRAVPGAVVVVRSGCYAVHDHGMYDRVSPIAGLEPAVTVRGEVISAPEPGLVVVGLGKRDVPHDADLPTVLGAWDAKGRRGKRGAGTVTALYDHHAVVRVTDSDLAIGDLVDFGISHPCGAFDRWPVVTVIDDDGRVVDEWATQFLRRP
nr:alanine racemase [Gordonia araii]